MSFYKYQQIEWNGRKAYYKEINSSHIYHKYNSIGVSNSALYQMEDDALIVIQYIGKTEDCKFIARVDSYKNSKLVSEHNGDTQKHIPIYRLHKEDVVPKSNMTLRDIKTKHDKNKTKQVNLNEW